MQGNSRECTSDSESPRFYHSARSHCTSQYVNGTAAGSGVGTAEDSRRQSNVQRLSYVVIRDGCRSLHPRPPLARLSIAPRPGSCHYRPRTGTHTVRRFLDAYQATPTGGRETEYWRLSESPSRFMTRAIHTLTRIKHLHCIGQLAGSCQLDGDSILEVLAACRLEVHRVKRSDQCTFTRL